MIRESTLSRQIVRLSIMPHRDVDAAYSEAWAEEVKRAFRACCEDDAHAIRVVDHLVRHSQFRPTPADIYGAAEAVPRVLIDAKPDKQCGGCRGTGYSQVWVMFTTEAKEGGGCYTRRDVIRDAAIVADLKQKVDGHRQEIVDYVERCQQCSYGRALAVSEGARDAA